MRIAAVAFVALLLLAVLAAPSSAWPAAAHYELTEQTYVINENRVIDARVRFTLVTGPNWITSIDWPVYTADIRDNRASDDTGFLRTEVLDEENKIRVYFSGNGIPPRSKLTFNLSYTAGGLVSGSGPEYRVTLGALRTGDLRHDNYTIIIRGPSNTRLFLTNPQAEVVAVVPPTVLYPTKLGARDEFGGLLARFYNTAQPVYYKLTLTQSFSNPSQEASRDVRFDTILFSHAPWQFAALVGSSSPIDTLYVDEENNWHGVFKIGDIQAGGSKDLNIELIFVNSAYIPDIAENDVGTLAEAPAGLEQYLKADDYWEAGDSRIKENAWVIIGDEVNAYRVAKRIFENVSGYVKYVSTPQRKGALQTLLDGQGDCDCISDLVIALSRAAGLPARANFGWGYKEKLAGHAWVEFYLPGVGWQPAEPTWAQKSGNYLFRLDPVHLLRSVRGVSSSESYSRCWWGGGKPSMGEEKSDLISLTKSEAKAALVTACERAIGVASNLLASQPDATLNLELELARAGLEQARAAGDEDAISLAQGAIQHANIVIKALGKPHAEPSLWDRVKEIFMRIAWPWLVIICALIAAGGIIWKIRPR